MDTQDTMEQQTTDAPATEAATADDAQSVDIVGRKDRGDPDLAQPDLAQVDMEALEATLDYIRPAVQADGGDLVLLGVDGGRVTIQMVGACSGCPLSLMTLKAGIERILQDRVPGVTEVVAI